MKTSSSFVSLFCALCIFVFAGFASNARYQSSRHYPDSATLRANVKTAMWQDPAVAPFELGVDVSRSTAHLTGTVDTLEHKRRAEQIALGVPGITSVDNDLLLRSSYSIAGLGAPARSEFGRSIEDPAILLGRVISSPDVYYGKILELEGTVDTVLSPNSFTMYSTGLRENPVLVIGRDRDVRDITPGNVVRVRGELEPFNRTAAAQRLNAELEPRKFDVWVNRAAVLAETIKRL
jgi:hypothetical protein